MDFVDGLKAKLPNEELAVFKWYVEKQSRETAQAQVTVMPVDTVQHCSPCPLNPNMPPDVYMRLESNEGKMDPELKELGITIGWYGSRNARTAVSSERGDVGSRTNYRRGLLDRGRGFKSGGKPLFTHETRGHAS